MNIYTYAVPIAGELGGEAADAGAGREPYYYYYCYDDDDDDCCY